MATGCVAAAPKVGAGHQRRSSDAGAGCSDWWCRLGELGALIGGADPRSLVPS